MKKKQTVLIIEDDTFSKDYIAELLIDEGYNVLDAENKKQVKDIIDNNIIDAVITDWKVADSDGIELLSLIRLKNPFIASILITGFGNTDIVIRAFKEGRVGYFLSKPFRTEELLAALESSLREQYKIKEKELIIRNLELMLRSKSKIPKKSELREVQNSIQLCVQTLFEVIPTSMFIIDADNKIVRVNNYFKSIFNFKNNKNKNFFEIIGLENEQLNEFHKLISQSNHIKNFKFAYDKKNYSLNASLEYIKELNNKTLIMGLINECHL